MIKIWKRTPPCGCNFPSPLLRNCEREEWDPVSDKTQGRPTGLAPRPCSCLELSSRRPSGHMVTSWFSWSHRKVPSRQTEAIRGSRWVKKSTWRRWEVWQVQSIWVAYVGLPVTWWPQRQLYGDRVPWEKSNTQGAFLPQQKKWGLVPGTYSILLGEWGGCRIPAGNTKFNMTNKRNKY